MEIVDYEVVEARVPESLDSGSVNYSVLKICRLSLYGKGVFYEKVVGSFRMKVL